MTTQLDAAFEIIAVDGSQAYFLDNTDDGGDPFENFETHSGLSLDDLDHADLHRFSETLGQNTLIGGDGTKALDSIGNSLEVEGAYRLPGDL